MAEKNNPSNLLHTQVVKMRTQRIFFLGNFKKEKYTQDHVYLFFYANHLRQAR